MKQILHTYKLRLTNLSQGNRSLRLGRLSKQRDIDLKDMAFINDEAAEQVLQKVIAGKDVKLLQKLDPRFAPANQVDRRLNYIFRTAQTLLEETGTYDLFLGYPFVEGKFADGTIARCPVLLFPVRLLRNLQGKPRWKLEVLRNESVTFNKTFFLAMEQYNLQRLPADFWEEEINSGNDWRNWLNELYEKIKEYEIEVNFNPRLFDLKLDTFPNQTKAELARHKEGILTFRSQAVLGIFPQSDSSLLQDYETIEAKPEAYGIDRFFVPKIPLARDPDSYIKEEERFFVTPVDQSQEDAILKVKKGKSVVIHGPPGTGKSQVIVNIIADAMAHGKKVLLVSQKRAALDVVHKRLAALGLSRFSVLVHDYRHDRNQIYRQISQQIDEIDQFKKDLKDLNVTKWEHDFKRLSREVDQLNREFEELHQALTSIRKFGASVHDLYIQCDAKEEILPVASLAKTLDQDGLEKFLDKMAQMTDYQDLLVDSHPWNRRLTFRHLQYEDKNKKRSFLDGVYAEILRLGQIYQGLSATFGESILDEELTKERISELKELKSSLEKEGVVEDLEVIARDQPKIKTVRTGLERLEKALAGLDRRTLLDDGLWSHYGNLVKHTDHYHQLQKGSLRFLSIPYQRARWFIQKILDRSGLKLDKKTFQQFRKEVNLFQKLHKWYVRFHDYEFFADFPLLDSQNQKKAWLEDKKEHAQLFEQIDGIKYYPGVRPSFHNGLLDRESWIEAQGGIGDLEAFTRQLSQEIRSWSVHLHPEQIDVMQEGIRNPESVKQRIEDLKNSLMEDFEDLRDLDRLLNQFSGEELESAKRLIPKFLEENNEEVFLQKVRNSVYFYWIEQAESESPILVEVSSRSWPRKEREFAEKVGHRRQKVTELILQKLKEQVVEIIEYNRLKNPVTYREIYHQVNKKRLIWSIRKLVRSTWKKGLSQLVPCWMASPESASAVFPMEKDFFDLVIFDEASQCFVERAIPIVLRGSQAIIAGDDKQLQPTNLYQVRYEDGGEDAFVEDEIALEVESILDLAKNTFDEAHLTWHYRSQAQELINFSNQAFYEGKLQVIPPAKPNPAYLPAMEWVDVKGQWRNNRNEIEGRRVVQLILNLVQLPEKPSIGVVTFNYFQQELIRDLLDEELESLASRNVEAYHRLQDALHKQEGEEFQGLFVKNIENVQGDERDIIVFSVGYGYNESGKLSTNFGLLNQMGGENRLNVAITRARRKIYVVCSFDPSQLKVDNSTHPGPRLFRDYLRYVKAVSDMRKTESLIVLNNQHKQDMTRIPPNPIADTIANHLRASGKKLTQNYGDTSYRVDIAVKAPGADYHYLAIECEGANYFSGSTAKEREIYRRALLENKGWEYKRIWGRNFWKEGWKNDFQL